MSSYEPILFNKVVSPFIAPLSHHDDGHLQRCNSMSTLYDLLWYALKVFAGFYSCKTQNLTLNGLACGFPWHERFDSTIASFFSLPPKSHDINIHHVLL